MAKPRYVLLDLMRIFAAYWVLVHHWTATDGFMIHLKQKYTIPDLPIILEEVLAGGYLGVDIFFILSGIVISKSAIHRNWVDFSQSRFIRLFPAYFVITLLAIAVVLNHHAGSSTYISVSHVPHGVAMVLWLSYDCRSSLDAFL
ncbi:acyltransferase family protein [Ochrobactrum intermedium]|nr:acyltransferase family protein [Brucella intermedia]